MQVLAAVLVVIAAEQAPVEAQAPGLATAVVLVVIAAALAPAEAVALALAVVM